MADPRFIRNLPGYLRRRYPGGGFGIVHKRIEAVVSLMMEGLDDVDTRVEASKVALDTNTVSQVVYVNSATGNDESGDGSSGNPYATFNAAYLRVPSSPTVEYDIMLQGAGPYALGGDNIQHLNQVEVYGDAATVIEGRTATSVGASSEANGLVITDADTAMTVDAHRGKMLVWTSGALNGVVCQIMKNDAQSVTITNGVTGSTYTLPGGTDTYNIVDPGTQMEIDGTQVIESSSQCRFYDIKFIGDPGTLYCNDTDQIEFIRCRFEINGLIAGRGGSLALDACSVANKGSGFGDVGMLTAITQGILFLKHGTFVDAVRGTNDNTNYVAAHAYGLIESRGEIGFRDLGPSGVTVRNGKIMALHDRFGARVHVWRFIDCDDAIRLSQEGEGWGTSVADLPNLHGNVASDYCVTASGGARARLGATSSITTATATNAVSADGGTTNIPQAGDGTFIEGGELDRADFSFRTERTFVSGDLSASVLAFTHNLGSQYVKVAIYNDSDVEVAPDSVTATSTTACDIDLTSQTVTGTWTAVVWG